jgi:Rad3-related DNA helicase
MSENNFPNLLETFPKGYEARPEQVVLLQQIQTALDSDKKFIMVCAPTGVGKSFVAASIANATREPCSGYNDYISSYRAFKEGGEAESEQYQHYGCAVLTVTKQLQDQYIKDFSNISLMKGKTNYQCAVDDRFDVEDGPCNHSKRQLKECWDCARCPYYEARNDALKNNFGVFNYSSYIHLPPHVKKRQVIICDEASELEGTLVDAYSLDISYEAIEKILDYKYEVLTKDGEIDGFKWLSGLQDAFSEKLADFAEILKDKHHKLYKQTTYKNKAIIRVLNSIQNIFDNWNPVSGGGELTEFIVELKEPDQYNKNQKAGVSFTPFRIDKISKYLFRYSEKVIFLSATIIDHKKELKDLGVNDGEYTYIDVGSVFDPKKSPIKTDGKFPLSYKTMDQNLPKVIDLTKKILEYHKNDKGLIHTVNFKITKKLEDGLDGNDRYLFRKTGATNQDILEEHKETDIPTVLISPSMAHGVDLKGDLGKFQIIMKVPYLPLGNKRIKRLSQEDYRWYINKTLSTLVQMAGRCTRHKDDESVTYILDGGIVRLLEQNWNKLPKYFRDRC